MNKKLAIIAALLLTVAVTAFIGISYGRYVTEINETLAFEAKTLTDSGTITLSSQNGWVKTQNGIKMDFSVASENLTRDICVRLSATEGLDSAVVIKLSSEGVAYTTKATAIEKDTQLYKKMGAGIEFSFLNGQTELVLSKNTQKNFTLTVEGASDAALLRLYAYEI